MDLPLTKPEQLAQAEALYCRHKALCAERGIGRLQEKSVHGILKFLLAPDPCHHEVKLPEGPVADIYDGETITEIQTGAYPALAKKLERLLPYYKVRVVCPIVRDRYLHYINKEDGSIEKGRKSPLHGARVTSLVALSALDCFLEDPNFSLFFLLVDVSEYRTRKAVGYRAKSEKCDCVPLCIADAWTVQSREDYKGLLPEALPEPFTAEQFGKVTHLRARKRYFALKLLQNHSVVRQIGRQGRAYLYTKEPQGGL